MSADKKSFRKVAQTEKKLSHLSCTSHVGSQFFTSTGDMFHIIDFQQMELRLKENILLMFWIPLVPTLFVQQFGAFASEILPMFTILYFWAHPFPGAGGVGLNLTSASVVVIFDPDWNPFSDLQAQVPLQNGDVTGFEVVEVLEYLRLNLS